MQKVNTKVCLYSKENKLTNGEANGKFLMVLLTNF